MALDWWTLGLQAVNVAILVWLLRHFFWRPVAAMIAQRRAVTAQALAEAKAARDKAETAFAEIARTRAGFGQERDAILAAAHAEADKASATSLAEAAKEAASGRDAAKAAIAREHDDAEAAWSARASQLAVDIASRLAARLDGAEVSASFLDWLLQGIRTLPETARREAAAEGVTLKAVSATALAQADQDRYRALIGEAFGTHPQIEFTADPALIAGLELHGPHFTIGNSWRADLGRILSGLEHAA